MLGWKYVAAEEEGQRYKVGKFILETKRVCRTASWEGRDDFCNDEVGEGSRRASLASGGGRRRRSSGMPPNEMPKVNEQPAIEFDSQDEDECEDLFSGFWTPQLAAKRRRQKQFAKVDEV